MDASFWHNKWEIGQIGFHENEVNPLLLKHIDKLEVPRGARLFIPLCGKTIDIAYLLELGYQVVGVELSEKAIVELFQELNLKPTITKLEKLTHYQARNIDIYVGDFFDLSIDILSDVDAIYDRASLIALPPETRQRYTQQLSKITHTAPMLLICLEYEQDLMQGPPFSISENEVHQHYEDLYSLDCVERNVIAGGLKNRIPGNECAWILKNLEH